MVGQVSLLVFTEAPPITALAMRMAPATAIRRDSMTGGAIGIQIRAAMAIESR